MATIKRSDTSTGGYSGNDLGKDQQTKSVLITNVPPETKWEELIIYFQKESNGGGEVNMDATEMLEDGKAVVVFDEEEVARRVLMKEHTFSGTLLQLKPHLISADDMKIFSLVSAKLDPSRFTVNVKELRNLLIKTKEKTGVDFIETCEGFVVAGTLEQIDKSCLFLSKYAKPPDRKRESPDDLENGQDNGDPLSDSDDEGKSLETLVLDVEPKLMRLLQKELDIIEKKYKMKIDWESKSGKAHLSPIGKDVSLFDQGKEEFITLYQKEFQDLQERDFSLDATKNIADLEKTTKELTQNFAVIIEKKNDQVLHIFGREEDVSRVMKRLQAKFGKRRGKKAYIETSTGELPKPDTYAQAAMLPLSKTLANGVVVSVHQGDITKVQVDVIVNAANENLSHGGGVAGAIVKQGGRQIQTESDAWVRARGRVPVGHVAHTGPGNLPYKRIFHAVGPQWKVHGEIRSRKFIFDACMKCFYLASKNRISSIALPGISSGIFGVPKEICAEVMFAAAEMFSAEASSANQLKDILFVNIDAPTYESFRGEFLNRYGMIKSEDLVIARNPGPSAFDSSPEAGDTRESRRQKFESTVRTGQANALEDRERKKRADAALQRISVQGSTNEIARSRENRREHEELSTSAVSESNSDFLKGFEEKERKSNDSAHSMKAVADNSAGGQRAFKEKELVDGMKGTDKHGQRTREEQGKNPEPKAKREKAEDQRKEEKKDTRKEKKEEEDKEKEKGNENKGEIENEIMKEKGKANEKRNNEDHLDLKNQPFEGKEQNELTKMFSNMVIHQSDDYELLNVEKKETNEKNDDLETEDPKNKERVTDKTKSINSITESEKSNAKKDVSGVSDEAAVSNAALHQSESKTLKMSGRGRGALGFAPIFPKPGHAIREGFTKKSDISHRDDKDVSECDQEGPPGLRVSQEGIEFAKTFTEDVEERTSTEVDNANGRKKQLKSECNGATYVVPSKKVKVDKGEQNGEVSAEQEENKAKTDVEEHDSPEYDEGKKDASDKREIEEEKIIDMSDKSEVSKEDENKNAVETQTNHENDTSSAASSSVERDGHGEISIHDSSDGSCVNDDQGADKILKDERNATSTKPTELKRQVFSEVELKGDNQSFEQDSKNKRNAASVEKSETKTIRDPETERSGDNNVEDPNSKGEHPAASESGKHLDSNINSSGERADPNNALDSDVKLDGEDSDKVANEAGKSESTESTDLNNIAGISVDTPSLISFEMLDMPKLNHGNSAPDMKTSENSDGSSESIEIINFPDGDEFSDSSPTNKREGDAHPPGPDINRYQMGSNGHHRENGEQDTDQEDEEKTPVLLVTEKNENDEKKDDATGSGGMDESANSDKERAGQTPSVEDLSPDEDMKMENADSSEKGSPVAASTKDQDCGVCYQRLDLSEAVKICANHLVCKNCLAALKKAASTNTCPVCHKPVQIPVQPPNGQIKSGVIKGSLPGYEGCETLYIDYEFPEGIQGPFHPNPDTPYDKLSRRTFLPNNEGGREVLELLKKALDAGVLFTVGKSTISGKDNQIIFNTDIDHKTNIKGGPTVSGYPDPGYLNRLKEQLKAKGIE